jgi:riboflavin synthase
MFTGLIEETGFIRQRRSISGGLQFLISAEKIMSDLKTDDSVGVDGVCLTVIRIDEHGFWTEAVGETLEKTTIGQLGSGARVNLERAMRLSDRLGGHLVLGHVNGIGRVVSIAKRGDNYFLEIDLPPGLERYAIDEGSVAVNGISLTIAALHGNRVGLSIIPHTWRQTNLAGLSSGAAVNIESDVLARYVEKLLPYKSGSPVITEDWLKKIGF